MSPIGVIIFKLPFVIKKKKKWYVSCCPPLNVSSQGETRDEALKNLVEATKLFITSCMERRVFDKVMAECKIKVTKIQKPLPKKNFFDIPIPLQINTPQKVCHA